MIKYHLGPQLSVWIMQVSLFSSLHINRFCCIIVSYMTSSHLIYLSIYFNLGISEKSQ